MINTNTFVSTSLTGQIDQQGSIVGWLPNRSFDRRNTFYIAASAGQQ